MAIDGIRQVQVEGPDEHHIFSVECDVEEREGLDAAIARRVSSEWSLHHFERQQPTLENVFLRYVRDTPGESNS